MTNDSVEENLPIIDHVPKKRGRKPGSMNITPKRIKSEPKSYGDADEDLFNADGCAENLSDNEWIPNKSNRVMGKRNSSSFNKSAKKDIRSISGRPRGRPPGRSKSFPNQEISKISRVNDDSFVDNTEEDIDNEEKSSSESEVDSVDDAEFDDEDDDENRMFDDEQTDDDMDLFVDQPSNSLKKDIYDFDAQSIASGVPAKALKKPQPAIISNKRARRTFNSKNANADTASIGKSSIWSTNIYSSLAAFMTNAAEMECYNEFVHSAHLNNKLDKVFVKICAPNALHSSLFYGPGASLQSLLSRINNPDRIFSVINTIVNKSRQQLLHRIVYFVPVVNSSLLGLDLFPVLTDVLSSIDNQIHLHYAFQLDPHINILSQKFELLRNSDETKCLVISHDVYSVLIDLAMIDRPSTCRIMVSLDVTKENITSFLILDDWEQNEAPFDRIRPELPNNIKKISNSFGSKIFTDVDSSEKTDEAELKEYLDEMFTWVEVQSHNPDSNNDQFNGQKQNARNESGNCRKEDFSLYDCLVVKTYSKKDSIMLVVIRSEEDMLVFNCVSEQVFMFERHGLTKDTVLVVEGNHTVYADQLVEERKLLIVQDSIYNYFLSYGVHNLKSMSKFLILDIDKRTPMSAAEEFDCDIMLEYDLEVLKEGNPIEDTVFDDSHESSRDFSNCLKESFKIVSMNGFLVGLRIDGLKVIREAIELRPLSSVKKDMNLQSRNPIHPHTSEWIFNNGYYSTDIKLMYNKTKEIRYTSGVLINRDSRIQKDILTCFIDYIVDLVLEIPVLYSLYDIIFRLAQASLPQTVLAINCNEDGNVVDPANCCVFCLRELKTILHNLNHELRHLLIPRKFRCKEHQIHFPDVRAYRQHLEREHTTSNAIMLLEDLDATANDQPRSKTALLQNRLDAPMCSKCNDYFPNRYALEQHSEVCDGTSFYDRTPLPKRKITRAVAESRLVCGLCGRAIINRDNMRYHMHTVHNQCRCCNELIRDMSALSAHYMEHYNRNLVIPDKEYSRLMICETCYQFCGTKHDFYFHQWTVHGQLYLPQDQILVDNQPDLNEQKLLVFSDKRDNSRGVKDELSYNPTGFKKIPCVLCGYQVRVMGTEYQRHLTTRHGIEVDFNLICRICGQLFENTLKLSNHLDSEHYSTGEYFNAGIQTIFRCNNCPFMGFQKTLLIHALEVHNDTAPPIYECITCTERFIDRRLWRAHLEKHIQSLNFQCELCNQAFKSKVAMQNHLANFHIGELNESRVIPIQCDYCDEMLPDYSGLRIHVVASHPEVKIDTHIFDCTVCNKLFNSQEELTLHEDTQHSGAVKCDVCGKLFDSDSSFQIHRMKHFKARLFQCTDCNAAFKTKLSIKRHIRVEHLHIGPEKFECQICGKIVSQISMHMLTHKEARFECEFCGRKFTKACYYHEHTRIHKGERPYGCHICEMRFNKKSNLNVHLRMHEKYRDEEGNYLELKPKGRASSTIFTKDPFAIRRMVSSVSVGTKDFVDWSDFNKRTKSCDTSDLQDYSDSQNGYISAFPS